MLSNGHRELVGRVEEPRTANRPSTVLRFTLSSGTLQDVEDRLRSSKASLWPGERGICCVDCEPVLPALLLGPWQYHALNGLR